MGKRKITGDDGKTYVMKEAKPIYKKWWFWLIAIVILAIGFGNQGDSKKETTSTKNSSTRVSSSKPEIKESTQNEEVSTTPESSSSTTNKPADTTPTEYKTALRKAKSYSDMMYMSKLGIYNQLTSEYGEKYAPEAAQYAVDNLNADYNKNALEKAKSYQETMSMSPEAIRDQLTSEHGEQFTPEEADYAIQNLN